MAFACPQIGRMPSSRLFVRSHVLPQTNSIVALRFPAYVQDALTCLVATDRHPAGTLAADKELLRFHLDARAAAGQGSAALCGGHICLPARSPTRQGR
ncbi:hypothetical protein H4219_002983 [Mycoemilia scoparia]|uniref:Uncharacterized protein n=1 Tax=Mycoemilia scoparia TaxID=417184 RepID=A0A9W8A2M6_9FUNG|nr:hypothetical protein H4219_002966 [Mycoemilia scoparia]KAJ1917873.1 hypothetical protein H4219_002983 [Mycoemilia scoparia]